MNRKLLVACATLFFLAHAAAGRAQTAAAPQGALHATRTELQQLLGQYELAAKASGYSAEMRERARYEAALIKQRLEHGDFQVGDRIAMVVEGEASMSDTLVVTSAIAVALPSGDTVSLRNVLRSELQGRLEEAVAKVVKNPVVHTESYLRMGIMGAVGSQGFYTVRSEALLTDVLMGAGGLAQTAKLEKIRIERDQKTIWEGESLQKAITEGRTVDQLSLRAGDMLIIPAQSSGGRGLWANIRTFVFAISGVFGLIRVLDRL